MRSPVLLFAVIAAVVLVGLAAVAIAGKDYYALLGVSRSATTRDIKKAYRKLSLETHPDKNPGNAAAQERFLEITTAYEVLSDDNKRRVYDQHGEEGLKNMNNQQGGGGGMFNFADLFGFGGGGQQQQRERKGPNIVVDFEVSLEDLYNGRELEAQINKQVICPSCSGSGAENPDDVKTCPSCQGRGVRIEKHQLGPGFFQQVQVQCNACGGTGKIFKSKCKRCNGAKVVNGENNIDISIVPGMPDGHKIEFPMEADQGPDITAGDVVFVVKTAAHPRFERRNNDLHTKVRIPLLDALVGFTMQIEHLDGHKVPLARTAVTRPGQVLKVQREGMPLYDSPNDFGDLYVTVEIEMPAKLTEAQKEAARALFSSIA
eukprot:a841449_44.p1 GENE.a841449_44~~a841449_44.p1  ORF type:complete len:398 (-),score=172.57 a841449_44:19-1140(-)